jgi:hypothetical protein
MGKTLPVQGISVKMPCMIPRDIQKERPSETRIQMMRFTYPAKNSQGKWNEITDSGNSKARNQMDF